MVRISKYKRIAAMACALTLSVTTLIGCGSNSTQVESTATKSEQSAQSATSTQEAAKPTKLSIMTLTFSTDAADMNNDIARKIQEFTNTELEITWVPIQAYADKLNLTIASNEMPNIVLSPDTKANALITAIRSGAFWEVGPYFKDYPNYLSKQSEAILFNTSVDGKNYGLPRWRPMSRSVLLYRQDWLENLGLKEPTNIEELYNVLKAFTNNDPDKNGKNDTVGLALDKNQVVLDMLSVIFGTDYIWGKDEKGNLQPSYGEKEYLDMLKWIKKLYDEKIINQDFAAVQSSKDLWNKGQAGMIYGAVSDLQKQSDLTKAIPTAKVYGINKVQGPKGIRVNSWGGSSGAYYFPKSSNKTEADVKACLSFFDKVSDEKIQNLLAWGIEGVHYTLQDGKVSRTGDQTKLFAKDLNSFDQLIVDDNSKRLSGNVPFQEDIKRMHTENEANTVLNPVEPFVSDTNAQKGQELYNILVDARVQFIMGVIDEAGYKKAMEKWHQTGGDKVAQELGDQLAKVSK